MTYHRGLRLLFICALGILASCSTFQGSRTNGKWSYRVVDGIENSFRSYLLVYKADTNQEMRFEVGSRCSKPHQTEGTYGLCAHTVNVEPLNKTFTLNTGEDVVIVHFTWDAPPILGTIEYGCCAGPDTASFYTDYGLYLGKLYGRNFYERGNYNNVISRTYDMRNGTRYGNKIYLMVLSEKAENEYMAFVFEKGRETRNIPVRFTNANINKCDEWYIENFIAYGNRKDITLEVQGYFCNNPEGMIKEQYSCTAHDDSIKCEVLR